MLSSAELEQLQRSLASLTTSQLELVSAAVKQFELPYHFERKSDSDFITPKALEMFGDSLRIHHAFSRQALSKDRFEFALERALNRAEIKAELASTRTNRGHDITVEGIPISLKTQADSKILANSLHISKFMELGKGAWNLAQLRDAALEHMQSYERIFQLRRLRSEPPRHLYELVEIPKRLLQECANAELVTKEKSRQSPKPGYGYVYDTNGKLKFALYFDGGTERKLQIKALRKDLCVVHATWEFNSTPLEESIPG